jgi:hypothetical protein
MLYQGSILGNEPVNARSEVLGLVIQATGQKIISYGSIPSIMMQAIGALRRVYQQSMPVNVLHHSLTQHANHLE